MRLHGNVYKQPDIPQDKLDELANKFLVGTDIKDLPPDQQAQARNLTAEIYVVQQENQQVTFDFVDDVSVAPEANGGAVNAVSWRLWRGFRGGRNWLTTLAGRRRPDRHVAREHDLPGGL